MNEDCYDYSKKDVQKVQVIQNYTDLQLGKKCIEYSGVRVTRTCLKMGNERDEVRGTTLYISMVFLNLVAIACGDLESSEVTHQEAAAQVDGDDGAPGRDGTTGPTGAQGDDGDAGQHVVLVDQNGTEIGYYLERVDFDENTFEILTIEGFRTVIDLDDGTFMPPSQLASGFGFSCMYESADCSGECYGAEERARGYILNGQSGSIHYVENNASSVAITSNSHNVNTTLSTCTVQNIPLTNAVPTSSYNGILSNTLSLPINLMIKN